MMREAAADGIADVAMAAQGFFYPLTRFCRTQETPVARRRFCGRLYTGESESSLDSDVNGSDLGRSTHDPQPIGASHVVMYPIRPT